MTNDFFKNEMSKLEDIKNKCPLINFVRVYYIESDKVIISIAYKNEYGRKINTRTFNVSFKNNGFYFKIQNKTLFNYQDIISYLIEKFNSLIPESELKEINDCISLINLNKKIKNF